VPDAVIIASQGKSSAHAGSVYQAERKKDWRGTNESQIELEEALTNIIER